MKIEERLVIIEILLKVRRGLKERIRQEFTNPQYALCLIALNDFNRLEEAGDYIIFCEYIQEINKNKTRFYDNYGYNPKCKIHNLHWVRNNYKSRLKWLEKRINIEKSKIK